MGTGGGDWDETTSVLIKIEEVPETKDEHVEAFTSEVEKLYDELKAKFPDVPELHKFWEVK